ncbi:flagellar hook-length control protein FliK [Desulfobulbus alkaliphilus]|uniref:flagellar hook-length control protein FliK n=1 Tax=Desulfobulbus alkaliphilus TaxID=869814 RepID=UPI0019661570|nr:flagellar hook-length control protein FliK [Desulfobulbus alkaliphilus]MBM9537430.1 flagellar hook-length control protein FliK [Desulfobulbus alkaliphilus]
MHFSPFISAEMLSGGPPDGKPASKAGAKGLFADHLISAAHKQADISPHIAAKKASRDDLMALFAALPAKEGHDAHNEAFPFSQLGYPYPPAPGEEVSSLPQAMSAATPAVVFTNVLLSDKGEHLPPQRSAREISAIADSARGLNHLADSDTVVQQRSAREIPAASKSAGGLPHTLKEASSGTRGSMPKDANVEAGPQLTNIPASSVTNASGRNVSHDGGIPPLAVFDNTGNGHRSGQAMERGVGHGDRFKEHPGEAAVMRDNGGRTIIVRQFNQTEEMPSPSASGNRPVIETHGSPQDTRAHYIHANLPNRVPQGESDSKNGQQQENTSNQHKGSDPSRSVQQGHSDIRTASSPLAMTGGESEPLLFPHVTMTTPPVTTSPQSELGMLRLPSGIMVPEGTVIDQLIAHFSANRRLDSGSINLQIHPRELGALRMEIKVEQENIKAHITVQNPQAQEMIDRHLPRLREALEQQGLHLQQIEVTLAAEDNTNGRPFQENHPQQQQAGRFPRNSFTPSTPVLESESAGDQPPGTTGNISVHA